MQFSDAVNLTLGNSQLINVNNTELSAILLFTNTTSVIVDSLVTYGCASDYVLQFDNLVADLPTSLVQVQRSNFSSTSAGGIYVSNHSLTVEDTSFDSLSNINAYAILHDNTYGSNLTVSGCNFTNVSSAVSASQARMRLINSQVTDCGSPDGYNLAYAVVTVQSDSADHSDPVNPSTEQTVLVDGCYFAGNIASQGIIYMLGYDKSPVQTMQLYNTTFDSNYGYSFGGAVTLFAVGNVTILNCTFQWNRARTGLGAVYLYGYETQVTQLTVSDSHFYANNGTQEDLAPTEAAALTDTAECGGLYASYCQCVASINTVYELNIGTGLCVHGHGSTAGQCGQNNPDLFNLSTIVGSNGSAFFSDFMGRYNDIQMGLDIRGSSFINNSAASVLRQTPESQTEPIDFLTGGAALNILDVQFSFMSNNTFQNNIGRQGAGANLDTCFFSVFWNCTFDNNNATQQGGAIAMVNSHNLGVMVANSTLMNGQAVTGGAMYGDAGATITISNGSQLTHNQAVTDGGSVYCDSCQALLLQLGSNVSSNSAGQFGGAAYCASCVTVTAVGVTMSNNRCGLFTCSCICMLACCRSVVAGRSCVLKVCCLHFLGACYSASHCACAYGISIAFPVSQHMPRVKSASCFGEGMSNALAC